MEIAENYCSTGLTLAQRAEHALEYAELAKWRVGKDAERIGRPKKVRSDPTFTTKHSAANHLAAQTGRTTSVVKKDLLIAQTVDGEALRTVAGTGIDSQRELVALGKLPKAEQRKVAKTWAMGPQI